MKKKQKKSTPNPYATYGLAGGSSLKPEAGTTKPSEAAADEMRHWSREHQQ